MRIAWIGVARDGGGVPGMGRDLLEGILMLGAEVDFFTQEDNSAVDDLMKRFCNLRKHTFSNGFAWGRWYSRNKFAAFLSSTLARTRTAKRLSRAVIREHANRNFDCIFQLSQTELFALGKPASMLPPIVVYPCVHAAGELRWHRKEASYARAAETAFMHYCTRIFLRMRSAVQRKELQKPAMVIGMSHRFNELVQADYGVPASRMAVLYHPIRPSHSTVAVVAASTSTEPIRLLYIARMSVRKGVEMIVDLSHRLNDLSGQIHIEAIGGRTLWSDYTKHLNDLNPRIATYAGELKNDDVRERMRNAHALLLPSHYEPGGLVVGEALEAGLPVVVSDEVGSGEPLSAAVCRKFPAGDLAAFEAAVRKLVADIRIAGSDMRVLAQEEAHRHFRPKKVAEDLMAILQSVVRKNPAEPHFDEQKDPADHRKYRPYIRSNPLADTSDRKAFDRNETPRCKSTSTESLRASATVVAIGGSIAQGLGVTGHSYADQLATTLNGVLAESIIIKNLARSALRVDEARTLLDEVVSASPTVVVLSHGISEALIRPTASAMRLVPSRWKKPGWLDPRPFFSKKLFRGFFQRVESACRWRLKTLLIRAFGGQAWMTQSCFAEHLRQIVTQILERTDATVVLITQPKLDERRYPGSPAALKQFKATIVREAEHHRDTGRVILCDISEQLDCWNDYFADKFHPNRRGHEKIACAIARVIVQQLDRPVNA